MNEKEIKNNWNFLKKRPFLFIATFILAISISWTSLNFIYNEILSSKDNVIETKQTLLGDKDKQLESKDIIIEEKNNLINELRHEILKENIKNNALNISIQNSNVQTNSFTNWSCSEKDIIIDEFANKISDQDEALNICNNNYDNLQKDYKELEKQIPDYSTGFIGKDISLGKGLTYQADGGKFMLSVIDTQAIASLNKYQTIFRLNGNSHTLNLGQSIVFEYYGANYTINLKSTNNPAKFYVYKSEDSE